MTVLDMNGLHHQILRTAGGEKDTDRQMHSSAQQEQG